MGLRIQTNIAGLNAQRNLGISQALLQTSLERLSSGFRINSAKDDAAGLSIANNLRATVTSLRAASRNATQAGSLAQIAEGAMNSLSNVLNRMRELAVQAASAKNDSTSRTALNNENTSLISEIDRIVEAAEFNGSDLIDGTFGASLASTSGTGIGDNGIVSLQLQGASSSTLFTVAVAATSGGRVTFTVTNNQNVDSETVVLSAGVSTLNDNESLTVSFAQNGFSLVVNNELDDQATANAVFETSGNDPRNFQIGAGNDPNADRLALTLTDLTASGLGVNSVDISTTSGAQSAIDTIDSAINTLNTELGSIGSFQNRLGFAQTNLGIQIQNTAGAESVIRDADIAAETTDFTRSQILVSAGVSILAQANLSQQAVLALLQ